jgi:hypothetical protein
MQQLFDEIQELIGEFIRAKKKEIKSMYNIALSENSISGAVKTMSDNIHYIGEWRLVEKEHFWEAVYNEPKTESEEVEVVIEIKRLNNRYVVSDWYVKELF